MNMRVLFVTSEVSPIIKTGGLADVSAALPAALFEIGVEIRILIPGYPQVLKALPKLKSIVEFNSTARSDINYLPPSRILRGKQANGLPVYVFDCPELYLRGGGIYQDESGNDWSDNAQRFGYFSKVAAILSSAESPISWKPHILHCNDWQSGLAPAYLQYFKLPALSVVTIHNLAFQGNFPPEELPKLGLPWDCYQPEGLEFYGNLSFLKAALYYADHITTVSPTYAKEIQTDTQGLGLHGLLAHRSKLLTGILNGIDETEWDPSADHYLVESYSLNDISGKSANKLALQKRLGLNVDIDIPLFGMVSRFAHQKGLDTVLEAAESLINMPAQLVLLGSGDNVLQTKAIMLAHLHPGKIAAYVGFDEGLSHLIEAGSDIFLMPSRFEPCGLNQMYSQRYGTPPVVSSTGGLIDTVVDCDIRSLKNHTASGFVIKNLDTAGLLQTIKRVLHLYHDKPSWLKLQRNCMKKDLGWGPSAAAYLQIYSNLKNNMRKDAKKH